jgi:hypothetical protein
MDKEANKLVEKAKSDLAKRLPVMRGGVEVASVKRRTFRDSGLGVHEPGKMYAQVITPGYVITLIADGKRYRYHGANGHVVLASNVR